MSFEENEISINANGGTELAKRQLADLLDPELLSHFQIIASRPRELKEDKIRIFWCHDLPEDPESAKLSEQQFQDKFHKFVFVSDWQYARYQLIRGVPYDGKSQVIETGVKLGNYNTSKWNRPKKIKFVYTSTPQRGLDVLVAAFTMLAKNHPDIELDVYSSFKIYGWNDADKPFEPLFRMIEDHPQMNYKGVVPNDQLLSNLGSDAHVFAYPSTWLETSCRAMIEAMSLGMYCVHPNYGALSDTSGHLNKMYQGSSDRSEQVVLFYKQLESVLAEIRRNEQSNIDYVGSLYTYVKNRYNIDNIVKQWDHMLRDLLDRYPTIESRGFIKEQFVYRSR